MRTVRTAGQWMLTVLLVMACGPEPTTPADTSLHGVWAANAHLFALSNIRMNLLQEAEGIVSGEWTATGDGDGGWCPSGTQCTASGGIIGRNTVAQVEIHLLGAGKFEGVLVESARMRGIFAISTAFDTITFVRQSTVLPPASLETH